MGEGEKSPAQSPLKRKSDLVPVEEGEDERTAKQQKPDAPPLEELGDASLHEEEGGGGGNADAVKKRSVLSAADKGKMVVEYDEDSDEEFGGEVGGDEEGSDEEEDDQDSENGDDDDEEEAGEDVDVEALLADDSLTEMDVDNILPIRTRPRDSLKRGSSVVESKKDDESDDRDYCEGDEDTDSDLESDFQLLKSTVEKHEREKKEKEGEKTAPN